MATITELSFEEAYAELSKLVNQLEQGANGGAVSLDESLALYERGRALSEHCQKLLDDAELRVSRLNEKNELDPL